MDEPGNQPGRHSDHPEASPGTRPNEALTTMLRHTLRSTLARAKSVWNSNLVITLPAESAGQPETWETALRGNGKDGKVNKSETILFTSHGLKIKEHAQVRLHPGGGSTWFRLPAYLCSLKPRGLD